MVMPVTLPMTLPPAPPLQPAPASRAADTPAVLPGQPSVAPAAAGQSFSSMIDAIDSVGGPAPPGWGTPGDGSDPACPTPLPSLPVNAGAGEHLPPKDLESSENTATCETDKEMPSSPTDPTLALLGLPQGHETQPPNRPFMQPLLTIDPGRSAAGEIVATDLGLPLEPLAVRLLPDTPATATITVDPGLAGALRAIRDELRRNDGAFAAARERLQAESRRIASDSEALARRSERYLASLNRIFASMDGRVAASRSTQSFLEQQVKIWSARD